MYLHGRRSCCSRLRRVCRFDPPLNPRLGGGFGRNPQGLTVLDYRSCNFVYNRLFINWYGSARFYIVNPKTRQQAPSELISNNPERSWIQIVHARTDSFGEPQCPPAGAHQIHPFGERRRVDLLPPQIAQGLFRIQFRNR